MKNYFKGTKDHPYHLSIGAVAVNEKNEVACHYFKDLTRHKAYRDFKDFYILMRETMEMGESIEETLHRGLMEEFGMTGEITTFLGSTRNVYFDLGKDSEIEKTTLYFLVKSKTFEPSLRSQEDLEKESEIQWHPIDVLISKITGQAERLNASFDESEVLKKAKLYLKAVLQTS